MSDPISLELDRRGTPVQVTWQNRQWSVTDTPTELDMDYLLMTHPLPAIEGWRFQGTDENGDSRIFDVHLASGCWQLLHVYA